MMASRETSVPSAIAQGSPERTWTRPKHAATATSTRVIPRLGCCTPHLPASAQEYDLAARPQVQKSGPEIPSRNPDQSRSSQFLSRYRTGRAGGSAGRWHASGVTAASDAPYARTSARFTLRRPARERGADRRCCRSNRSRHCPPTRRIRGTRGGSQLGAQSGSKKSLGRQWRAVHLIVADRSRFQRRRIMGRQRARVAPVAIKIMGALGR
jgi:hypothetical protein